MRALVGDVLTAAGLVGFAFVLIVGGWVLTG